MACCIVWVLISVSFNYLLQRYETFRKLIPFSLTFLLYIKAKRAYTSIALPSLNRRLRRDTELVGIVTDVAVSAVVTMLQQADELKNRRHSLRMPAIFEIYYEEKWYYCSILGHIRDDCAKQMYANSPTGIHIMYIGEVVNVWEKFKARMIFFIFKICLHCLH